MISSRFRLSRRSKALRSRFVFITLSTICSNRANNGSPQAALLTWIILQSGESASCYLPCRPVALPHLPHSVSIQPKMAHSFSDERLSQNTWIYYMPGGKSVRISTTNIIPKSLAKNRSECSQLGWSCHSVPFSSKLVSIFDFRSINDDENDEKMGKNKKNKYVFLFEFSVWKLCGKCWAEN